MSNVHGRVISVVNRVIFIVIILVMRFALASWSIWLIASLCGAIICIAFVKVDEQEDFDIGCMIYAIIDVVIDVLIAAVLFLTISYVQSLP